ncbi:ribosome maturation protein RimP [Erythrobacter sp. NFXS35]|uniref:ribosome maturation protein RimP n=1 Tax=Erythrobacter sp. NFXS35 TaxID=2818436 RepID=UPI0032DEECAE
MADIARLTALIEPEAQALGFELVRVAMIASEAGDGGMALQIMAEDPATGQLVIDQCAALSRRVSDVIDTAEEAGEVLIEGTYHLEVSSPGIDRPLTREKDFANWVGHEVKIARVKDADGPRTVKGTLEGLHADRGINFVHVTDAKGVTHMIASGQIHSAKLVLTDALIAATRPLDTSGADELIEDTEKADD